MRMQLQIRSMRRSNLIGNSYDKQIPRIAKASKMKINEVMSLICKLKMSIYEGKDPKALQKVMSRAAARNYLTDLILYNAKLRSELSTVLECDSNKEEEINALPKARDEPIEESKFQSTEVK